MVRFMRPRNRRSTSRQTARAAGGLARGGRRAVGDRTTAAILFTLYCFLRPDFGGRRAVRPLDGRRSRDIINIKGIEKWFCASQTHLICVCSPKTRRKRISECVCDAQNHLSKHI